MDKQILRLAVVLAAVALVSCANRGVGPQGGPKDSIPPVAVKYEQKDKPKVEASCARLDAVRKQQYDRMCRFYSEYIPMWRNAVTDGMDMARAQLVPMAKQREKIGKELYEMGHEASYAAYEIFPFIAANTYFEISRDVVDFELDFSEVQ
ncbi:MAG: hypothetical protein J5884_05475 [Paludibacteraceae bacterium]|nr:hypothetical protein [Paludibacteraceae bacterium]